MNKKILFTGVIFFLVGAGLLVGDYFMIKGNVSFLANSVKTEGKVINILKIESSSSNSKGSYNYSPEVSFTDNTGQEVTFKSSLSTSMPTYKIGEKVNVIYNKDNPQEARINTFFQLWFGVLILSFMGTIFFLVGLFTLINQKRKKYLKNELLTRGTKIMAKVISVQSVTPQVRVNDFLASKPRFGSTMTYNNDLSPVFQIVAQWLNPADNQMYVFNSDDLAYNPESYVMGKEIGVYIDPQNPKKYYVDISALPQISN